jgi:trehalose 6-phosphate phosphatase
VPSAHLLAPGNRRVLEQLAARRSLLAFDFDGTLAPVVPEPARAAMRAATARRLRAVAAIHPCVVLSGRALGDLKTRLHGVPLLALAGNHGAEIAWNGARVVGRGRAGRGRPRIGADMETAASARRVRTWRRALQAEVGALPGVFIEDKRLSLTVHFRRAPDAAAAARAVRAAAARFVGARLVGGKFGLNLLPAGGADKGTALRRLWRMAGVRGALYVGDDATDEDAFALRRAGLIAVRVGRSTGTAAAFHLARQREIDDLLELLLGLGRDAARPRRSSPAAGGRR